MLHNFDKLVPAAIVKDKKRRVEEQKSIASLFEMLGYAIQALDQETGDGKNVPKFVCHDGYTYSIVMGNGKKITLKAEVE